MAKREVATPRGPGTPQNARISNPRAAAEGSEDHGVIEPFPHAGGQGPAQNQQRGRDRHGRGGADRGRKITRERQGLVESSPARPAP